MSREGISIKLKEFKERSHKDISRAAIAATNLSGLLQSHNTDYPTDVLQQVKINFTIQESLQQFNDPFARAEFYSGSDDEILELIEILMGDEFKAIANLQGEAILAYDEYDKAMCADEEREVTQKYLFRYRDDVANAMQALSRVQLLVGDLKKEYGSLPAEERNEEIEIKLDKIHRYTRGLTKYWDAKRGMKAATQMLDTLEARLADKKQRYGIFVTEDRKHKLDILEQKILQERTQLLYSTVDCNAANLYLERVSRDHKVALHAVNPVDCDPIFDPLVEGDITLSEQAVDLLQMEEQTKTQSITPFELRINTRSVMLLVNQLQASSAEAGEMRDTIKGYLAELEQADDQAMVASFKQSSGNYKAIVDIYESYCELDDTQSNTLEGRDKFCLIPSK